MKPIVITIQDNKIVMDINEFKRHIDDAYHQGYHDASSITCGTGNRWWNDLTQVDKSLTFNDTNCSIYAR